jgi:hypothetical protein
LILVNDMVYRLKDVIGLGRIIGALPVKMGSMGKVAFLLVFTEKALVIMNPGQNVLKLVAASAIGLSDLVRARSIVALSKMTPEELAEKLGSIEKKKVLVFITRDQIEYVEFKRKFFGLGSVVINVYLVRGKKIVFTLLYGPGTGISRDEVVDKAMRLFGELGIRVENKLK